MEWRNTVVLEHINARQQRGAYPRPTRDRLLATCNPSNPPMLRDHARRGPAPDVQGARASCVPGNPTRIKKKAPPYQFVALKHRLRTCRPRGGEDDGGR